MSDLVMDPIASRSDARMRARADDATKEAIEKATDMHREACRAAVVTAERARDAQKAADEARDAAKKANDVRLNTREYLTLLLEKEAVGDADLTGVW